MFTDSHCHIYNEYYEDIQNILQKANSLSVSRFFVSGCSTTSNSEVLSLLKYPNVYGCLGLHPEETDNCNEEDFSFLESNLTQEKSFNWPSACGT